MNNFDHWPAHWMLTPKQTKILEPLAAGKTENEARCELWISREAWKVHKKNLALEDMDGTKESVRTVCRNALAKHRWKPKPVPPAVPKVNKRLLGIREGASPPEPLPLITNPVGPVERRIAARQREKLRREAKRKPVDLGWNDPALM